MSGNRMSIEARVACEVFAVFIGGFFGWPFALSAMYSALGGDQAAAALLMVFGFLMSVFVAFFWGMFREDILKGERK